MKRQQFSLWHRNARVAPTGSRLYRRLAIGWWQNYVERAVSPRYSRLPVGATFIALVIMRTADETDHHAPVTPSSAARGQTKRWGAGFQFPAKSQPLRLHRPQ